MRRGRNTDPAEVAADLTPMIDVTFLLLIFFLCSIQFKVLEGKLSTYLPKDVGGAPTQCMTGLGGACELCPAIPDCSGQPQLTQLTGRVITPGRTDGNVGNQVGGADGARIIDAARDAFVHAMSRASLVTAAFAVVGAIVALRWLPARAVDHDHAPAIDADAVDTADADERQLEPAA